MSIDSRGYWREEFSLIAILLLFFVGIVALSYHLPFDARLFPIVIGSAGILLTLGIAIEQVRRRGARDASTVDDDDPAAKADWPRYATALLAAPAFGLMFWLVGFIVASRAPRRRTCSMAIPSVSRIPAVPMTSGKSRASKGRW